ncbi:hypothetical protein HFP89_06915 [Wenzhouxiangella sp. XN79A]|uniref:hypothetical protein n=1 Tax=Wenzhouxiangella sp. XN79A TaxID=2724193 RepID=UPI00144A5527|nr:hypothetical protein [Wenzhouxiangella sp. XN79A]NKI34891.1 hypothetical protein [Wenzhouxiangella sp. XN79A]
MSENDYTAEALGRFLKQAGMEGLINPATARARRNALDHLAGELTEAERGDIRTLDVDALVARFHKLEGASIRPETLAVYGDRLKKGLDDYLRWLDAPSMFKPSARERVRNFARGSRAEPALSDEQRAAERIRLEATENPSRIVPVPVRDDHVVYIDNLPLDLTAEEADRIARVVRAFADRSAGNASGDDE